MQDDEVPKAPNANGEEDTLPKQQGSVIVGTHRRYVDLVEDAYVFASGTETVDSKPWVVANENKDEELSLNNDSFAPFCCPWCNQPYRLRLAGRNLVFRCVTCKKQVLLCPELSYRSQATPTQTSPTISVPKDDTAKPYADMQLGTYTPPPPLFGHVACLKCGQNLQFVRKKPDYSLFRFYGLLGWLMTEISTGFEHVCSNCGPAKTSDLPARHQAKQFLIRISLFIFAILIGGVGIAIFSAIFKSSPR